VTVPAPAEPAQPVRPGPPALGAAPRDVARKETPFQRAFWRRRLPLRLQLTLAVVVLLAALQVIGLFTYQQFLDERREAEVENAAAVGEAVAALVAAFARDLEGTTLGVAVALGAHAPALDQATVGPQLDDVVRAYSALRTIFITNPQGIVTASSGAAGVGVDTSARPYIGTLQGGAQTVWSGSLTGIETGQVTVVFARPIVAAGGAVRGFLITAFYPEQLLDRLSIKIPPDARLTYIDESGLILFSTDRRITAASATVGGGGTAGVSGPGAAGSQTGIAAAEPVRRALAGEVVRLRAESEPFGSERRYGVYAPLGRPNWVVAFTRPQGPLEASLAMRFLQAAGAITIVMLLGAAFVTVVTRRLSRPLDQLAAAARGIAQGKRSAVPEVVGDPEVMELSRAMRRMDDAVAERERSLSEALTREQTARGAAEAAVRQRDEFLSVAAHELKTPITSIRAYSQLTLRRIAREDAPDPQRLRRALSTVDEQSGKLALLVDQLLDVTRIEEGKLALERSATNVGALVQRVATLIRDHPEGESPDPSDETEGGSVRISLPPDPLIAEVDPLRIEQVIANLLTNALKFGEGNPIDVTVSNASGTDVNNGQAVVQIAVRDHGLGIPPEAREKLFERFYQAHSQGHLGGMGLGLYVSRQIVDLHGGTITAEFPDDGGTRFVVSLPAGLPAGLPVGMGNDSV